MSLGRRAFMVQLGRMMKKGLRPAGHLIAAHEIYRCWLPVYSPPAPQPTEPVPHGTGQACAGLPGDDHAANHKPIAMVADTLCVKYFCNSERWR